MNHLEEINAATPEHAERGNSCEPVSNHTKGKTLTFSDKPTRRIVNARTPHGVNPQIVVTVYPNATIGLRELGRRKEYQLDAWALYVSAVIREVSKAKMDRKKGRK